MGRNTHQPFFFVAPVGRSAPVSAAKSSAVVDTFSAGIE